MSLSVAIPGDFVEKMQGISLPDADRLIDALDTDPCVAIRINQRKNKTGEIYSDIEPVSWCKDGYYLPNRPIFTLNPLLHAGVFYVQDASSMIYQQLTERLVESLGNRPMALLDFCAAPGGKTTAMINALPEGSVAVANEFVTARGKMLRENLEKWGYPAVITTGSSSQQYSSLPEIFDIIAVDAPCSGEGMMRKEEEARRQWSPKLVKECAALQRSILSEISTTLRPGGYLIYSTCTFNLEEDEKNSLFIRDELGLEPIDPSQLALHGIENVGKSLIPEIPALRFMPHLTKGEGLYVSIFRKPGVFSPYLENEGSTLPVSHKKEKSKKGDQKSFTRPAPEIMKRLGSWFLSEYEMTFEQNGSLLTALPSSAQHLLTSLRKAGIRITAAGLPAAEVKGRDLIPDSRIVLSNAFDPASFPQVELTEEDALKYLRRDTIQLPGDTPKEFITVTYKGYPLGLLKNLGNRANNLFPAPWRIRM